jgi:N-acetylglucosamine PTS system EIICBA or EIICB component
MGVLSGILTGVLAGVLYNRYQNIRLPEYLAFFGGKRFIPIATGLSCLLLGMVLAWAWAPVQHGVNTLGNWLVASGPVGPFVYGVLNVIFRVVGLHHIVNSLVWFVFGTFTPEQGAAVTGDIHRFFAGDPSAGAFMTGFFPVFMFALPAACLAMYHAAPKDKRAAVAGLFLSLALTTFLTGITEPVEYTFLFLSPLLYSIHALLTGVSMAVCQLLGIKLGFTFSAGLIDYVLSFGLASHPLLMLPVGILWGLIYYFLFRFFIHRFNLATPGRGEENESASPFINSSRLAAAYLDALGGPGMSQEKVTSLIACAHAHGALAMTTIGTSQEGADVSTVRQIALMSKMAGADLHHIGDTGYMGIALPENIMAYSIAIRGVRHTYTRMARSINR